MGIHPSRGRTGGFRSTASSGSVSNARGNIAYRKPREPPSNPIRTSGAWPLSWPPMSLTDSGIRSHAPRMPFDARPQPELFVVRYGAGGRSGIWRIPFPLLPSRFPAGVSEGGGCSPGRNYVGGGDIGPAHAQRFAVWGHLFALVGHRGLMCPPKSLMR